LRTTSDSSAFHYSFLLLESSAPDNRGAQVKNGHYYFARPGPLGGAKPRQVPARAYKEHASNAPKPSRLGEGRSRSRTGKEALCISLHVETEVSVRALLPEYIAKDKNIETPHYIG